MDGGDLRARADPAVPQHRLDAVLVPFILRGGVRSLFALERPWLHAAQAGLRHGRGASSSTGRSSGLPLADTITYYLAGPIYVTVLAAFLLKEQVGWRRWSAVASASSACSSR